MLARLRGLLHGGSGNELARGLFDLFDYEAVRDAILFLIMGIDAADGVMTIDADGRVFHYPNLYVVDGSIVPTAIGPNPSKTIGALAERVAEKMIADGL